MSSPPKTLVWFITGCASGFGASLSIIALKAGHKVIATSRNPSKSPELVKQIEALGGIWLQLDVNEEAAHLQDVIELGTKKFGPIDVLVNNAGIALIGAIEDTSPHEARSLIDTNFFAPFNLIKAVLPSMRDRKSGTIVNISSAAGFDPRPAMSMYGASKSALEGMSHGLAKEVAPFGIRVLIVQPGAFSTNIFTNVPLTEKPLSVAYKNTEAGKIVDLFEGPPDKRRFVAENDTEKGCQAIFEVVTGTGRGEGKEKYLRLPLSKDCAVRTIQHVEKLREGHDAFKEIWESTGHDVEVLAST